MVFLSYQNMCKTKKIRETRVVIFVKVVIASTPEQEAHIEELVNHFYTDIFPMYFSDEEILKFKQFEIMSLTAVRKKYNGTLKEAFQLISSLQALIAVLEAIQIRSIDEHDKLIFDKNVKILEQYGLSFPFHLEHFLLKNDEMISTFAKSTNAILA